MQTIQRRFLAALKSGQWGLGIILGLLLLAGLIISALFQDRVAVWANNKIDQEGPQLLASILGSIWFPVVLFGLLAIIWAATVHWLWPRAPQQSIPRQEAEPGIDSNTRELASWMEGIAYGDSFELQGRLVVLAGAPVVHFREEPPYIDFVFEVFNGVVFPISIVRPFDGHICVAGRTLVGTPEIAPTSGYDSLLAHGGRRNVTIRQYLTDDDVNACLAYREPQVDNPLVSFDFGSLIVQIEPQDTHGFHPNKGMLRLPSRVSIRMEDLKAPL